MIIFPAVDIKNGQAVRLKKGLASEVTVFSNNPVEMALKWQDEGAKYLHLVDLDGAFEGKSNNIKIVQEISQNIKIPMQLGGGIRDIASAKMWLEEAGISRLIIGTMALENLDNFARLCRLFPKQIGVSLDLAKGVIKSRGWVQDTDLTIEQFIPTLEEAGADFLIYTDIERDGMQSGMDIQALEYFLSLTKLKVIAAGGLHSMEDVKNLYELSKKTKLEGAITGRAIYEGTLNLAEAVAYCSK